MGNTNKDLSNIGIALIVVAIIMCGLLLLTDNAEATEVNSTVGPYETAGAYPAGKVYDVFREFMVPEQQEQVYDLGVVCSNEASFKSSLWAEGDLIFEIGEELMETYIFCKPIPDSLYKFDTLKHEMTVIPYFDEDTGLMRNFKGAHPLAGDGAVKVADCLGTVNINTGYLLDSKENTLIEEVLYFEVTSRQCSMADAL